MKSKKQVLILFLIFIVSVFIWNIPLIRVILYPFMLFATFIHEFGHALMAIVTGGKVLDLEVFFDGSGLATTQGGFRFLIASGGYLGSSITGAILLILAADDNIKITKVSLFSVALIMLLSLIFFIKNILTGIIVIIIISAIFFIIFKAGDTINRIFLNFLAIQCCFYSLYNIGVVFGLSMKGYGENDAATLASLTFIPGPLWAILWAIVSFVIFGLVLKIIYKYS
ncbi:MAG: M50 family metallopeptidase [Cyanobacteriota bacterium]